MAEVAAIAAVAVAGFAASAETNGGDEAAPAQGATEGSSAVQAATSSPSEAANKGTVPPKRGLVTKPATSASSAMKPTTSSARQTTSTTARAPMRPPTGTVASSARKPAVSSASMTSSAKATSSGDESKKASVLGASRRTTIAPSTVSSRAIPSSRPSLNPVASSSDRRSTINSATVAARKTALSSAASSTPSRAAALGGGKATPLHSRTTSTVSTVRPMNTGEVRKPTVSLMASSAARTPKVAPARKESDEMKEKIRSLEGELTALKLEKSSQQTPPAGGAETAGPTLQAELDQAKLRASTLEAELKHAQDKLLELGQAAEAESNTVKELEANLRAGHTKEVEHLRVKHQSELSALSEESDSKDQQHQEALGALRAEFDDARNTSAETAKSSANAQKRLDEVINSHQREMQELNERQRTSDEAHKSAEKQVSHLTAELDGMGKVIDNLKDELQKQHQLSEKEHQEKSRQLISDHESSMKSVRDAHSKELSEVNDTHSRALAKQISTLKSERVEVEQTASKELTLANEKNQELEASLQAMKKGESELLAAEKQKSRGLETEITALQKSLEALEVEAKGREADRAGALSKLQEELVQSRKQLSEREKELASIREERPRELEHLKKSHAAEIEAAKARAQTQSTQLTDLKAGRELVQKNTQEQQSAHTAAMEAATKEHKSLLQKKLDEHQEAQRSHSNAQAEMQKTHEATVSSLKAEHSKLLSASKAEGQKLSILEAQLATERGTVAKLQSQLRESSKTHDSALAALKTQLAAHEISKKQQIAALEASQRQRSASKADREILQKAHDDHQTRAKKSATDLAAAQQQLQALTAEHAALKLKLQHPDPSEADALRSRLSACTTEHETATAALLAQHAAAAAAKEAEVKALKDGQKRAAAIEAQKFAAERQGLERERDVAENEVKKVRRALEVAKETANGDLKDLGTVFNERVAEIEAERGLREGEIKAEREKGVGEVEVLKRKVAELEAARQTAGMKKGIKGSKWAVAEDVPATSSSKTDAAAARHLNGSKAAGAADEEEEDQEWPAEKSLQSAQTSLNHLSLVQTEMEQEHARVLAELDRIDRMTPEELRGEQPVAGHHPPSAVSATASATASATVPAPAAGGDAQKSHPPSSGGSRPRVGRSGLSAAAASFTPGSG